MYTSDLLGDDIQLNSTECKIPEKLDPLLKIINSSSWDEPFGSFDILQNGMTVKNGTTIIQRCANLTAPNLLDNENIQCIEGDWIGSFVNCSGMNGSSKK